MKYFFNFFFKYTSNKIQHITNNKGEIIVVFSTHIIGNKTTEVQTDQRKDQIVE